MPLSHKHEQLFVEDTFSKSIIFKVKSTFEPNVFKAVMKTIIFNSSPFAFLIINVKILSNFEKEWCRFDRRKRRLKKTRTVHFRNSNALEMKNLFNLCQNLIM